VRIRRRVATKGLRGCYREQALNTVPRLRTRRRGTEGYSAPAADDITALLWGLGQMRANDGRWPSSDGRYANYPRFKREWTAYNEMYHPAVNDDLVAKTLMGR
jgi:hypothetical protein